MKKNIIFSFWVIIIFAVQFTLLNHLSIGGVKPDLLLILVMGIGLFGRLRWYLPVSFLIGLVGDIFSFAPLGINALSKTVMAYLVTIFKRNIEVENVIVQAGSVFLVTLIDISFFYLARRLFLSGEMKTGKIFLIEPVYNAVLAVFIFWPMGKI